MSRKPTIECPECGARNYTVFSEQDGVAQCNECDEFFEFDVDEPSRRNKWDDDE